MLALAAALLAGNPVLAPAGPDDTSRPVLSARLLAPIPADAAIAIEPLDDSDENLRLRDEMAAALVDQHWATASDGALRLRFVTEVLADPRQVGSGIRGPRRSRGADRPLRDGFNPELDLPRGALPRGQFSAVQHRLRATLEQRDGAVLWQGEAAGTLAGNNESALWSELASAVIGAFGRNFDSRVRPPG